MGFIGGIPKISREEHIMEDKDPKSTPSKSQAVPKDEPTWKVKITPANPKLMDRVVTSVPHDHKPDKKGGDK